ncbi:MAG: 16S rRNA (adenine(1518)-N(6)/adenine(1519)-N(6))-dimethyltransferase RsmA [Pseudomonadales bacterium]|nr:16S rRNA (adenine(1518)-N(6)/adenine(1519)-N(6))-dimethyltransferase RsmA [Pseudomonadales bacterium]
MNEHRARKRFGQNFLNNPHYIEMMLSFINPAADEPIIEIGPGLGALTRPLLDAGAHITAIEIDRDLSAKLAADFQGRHFELITQDALKTNFAEIEPDAGKIRIIGNLPYNISTPLIFHLLAYEWRIKEMYFLLQREVVNRLAANPDTGAYGKLGIMVQYHCDVTPLFDIPPEAFTPQPKVFSSYVKITPRPYPIQASDTTHLKNLVNAAFQQRRKTLRNTLKKWISAPELAELGIAPDKRPENLQIDDYIRISNHLLSEHSDNNKR